MIQRIQTVYLLAIVALSTAMLFMPLATLQIGSEVFILELSRMSALNLPVGLVNPAWAILFLPALCAMLAFITIFLYKNRKMQIRFCIYNAILFVVFYGLCAFFYWKLTRLSGDYQLPGIAFVFPFICLILNYLATNRIRADEALIRSLHRLR